MKSKIFNAGKSDYESQGLFLGQDQGLLDTVNKKYPDIWRLYKTLKKMDWDENEFDYSSCNTDFKTCSPSVYNMMIKTLAWQWEADSVAARGIAPIMAPFISSSELWAAYMEVGKNECVHSFCYSEIVRTSFSNPSEVMAEVLAVQESLQRLDVVAKVFGETYKLAHEYALGIHTVTEEEVRDQVMLTVCTLLGLERIQFMSSFAVTFAICDTGLFNPIGKGVQKIAQEELEVHVELGKAILNIELKTKKGRDSFERIKGKVTEVLNEITNAELINIKNLFSTGDELVGVSEELLSNWALFNAKDVYKFLKIDSEFIFPKSNPLKFMEKWLDISKTQPSPQEEDNGQYKLNSIRKNDDGMLFEVDF
jgi:ribonucleoside-diphosphate reductase beta chain